MAKECGRSLVTTALRSSTGCAFHRKTSGCAALAGDSSRTHRQARYHDGQRSTSVNRSHTRSAEAWITVSLRTSIGGPRGRADWAEHPSQDQVGEPAKRRPQQGAAIPSPHVEHRLLVAERAEPLDAVVGAEAARPDAAEREIVLDVVQERAVDGDAAGGRSRQHPRCDSSRMIRSSRARAAAGERSRTRSPRPDRDRSRSAARARRSPPA